MHKMVIATRVFTWVLATSLLLLGACTEVVSPTANPPTEPPAAAHDVDLTAVKQYALDHAQQMKSGTTALASTAQAYTDLIARYDYDYQAAWAAEPTALSGLVTDLKDQWREAHTHSELNEGIIAGVPSLAEYDVWIDAGPSAEEDATNARPWTLELPDGRTLESPGNFFHSLLEPTIWGTKAAYTGLPVDLDGDGAIELGEALPEAHVLLAATTGLDRATQEMIGAVVAWQPSMEDAFTALVVMIPTMNEYFEQWKLSSFVAGQQTKETAFVGTSRLFDIDGILNGLDVTYQNVAPELQETEPMLDDQITQGFTELRGYVRNLYAQEQDGTAFTAEQAELFGTEAQHRATALAGQVSQAAALLNIEIAD